MLIIQRKTLSYHVSYTNYYVCQAKKIIGDSTDSFRKHVTIYFHASCIVFIIFCSRVTLCDGIVTYVPSNAWAIN
jgi:hypothetical protein